MQSLLLLAQGAQAMDGGDAAAAGVGLAGFFCCMMLPALALLGLWLWALIDCATRRFEGNDKIVWILVIIFANWIGALIYLFVGRSRGTKG